MSNEDHATLAAMVQRGGGFVSRLGLAGLFADDENLARLKAAFPDYWSKYTMPSSDETPIYKEEE